MRTYILFFVLIPGLLLSFAPPVQAAKKVKASSKSSDYREIPAFNWNLVSSGFVEVFRNRNREIESAEPNRFFPGTVAFALGRIDNSGHYLMLNCGSSSNCGAQRDMLEERMVCVCLLDVVRTPRVSKAQLYNARTWELTSLGGEYIEKIRKRYPDLFTRLGRLTAAALSSR